MAKRIKVDELLTFDAAPYLDSEEAIAAYLTESRVKLGSLLACMAREASDVISGQQRFATTKTRAMIF